MERHTNSSSFGKRGRFEAVSLFIKHNGELFSYCNRKCDWCPNKFVDRQTHEYINKDLFLRVIDELAEAGYTGAITFSRYNEPLSDVAVLNEAIEEIRDRMPNCKCITNTNGDYLTKEVLSKLMIDELTIMDYDGKGKRKALKHLKECGATVDKVEKKYIYAHFGNMQILYYLDWQKNRHITDRAGLLPKYKGPYRLRPCHEPRYFVGINYDGTVSPCCNIRNDCAGTQPFILGDLHTAKLSTILESEKAMNFMQNCEDMKFAELPCCHTCDNIGGRYTRGHGGISYE